MTLRILPYLVQGTQEWHDQRRGMVTASVVGQLVTPTLKVAANDYSRALTATLVAERLTGVTEPTYLNADMMRGVESEPYARETYSLTYTPAIECGFMVLERDGWQLGFSPDGLVGEVGLIEVKAPRAKGHLQTILSNKVPERHMAQIQAGLLVSGREWLDFISFHGGMPMWVQRVLPDERWFEAIIAAVEAFEVTAFEMAADYALATEGLAMTERLSLDNLGLVF